MTATVQAAILPPNRVQRKNFTRRERREIQKNSSIDLRLLEIGVRSLNKQSARRYMRQRVAELRHPRPIIESVTKWTFRHYLASALGILFSLVIFLDAIGLGRISFVTTFAFIASVGSMYWGAQGSTEQVKRFPQPKANAQWKSVTLDYYIYLTQYPDTVADRFIESPAIPPEVLETARRVQSIPYTKVFVHYLDKDPLLEVKHLPARGSSSSRFFACWDEAGFVP